MDGGSTDGTVKLAPKPLARDREPWPGFAVQRNVALDHATGDWVLEIDADEQISPRLRASVLDACRGPAEREDRCVRAAPPLSGRAARTSAKYPAYRSRMFPKRGPTDTMSRARSMRESSRRAALGAGR